MPARVELWTYGDDAGKRNLWRLDQAQPIRPAPVPREIEITDENVLIAASVLDNAAASRRRAREKLKHLEGIAGGHSDKAREACALKDRCVAYLSSRGVLVAVGRAGELVLWEGCGYTFAASVPTEAVLEERGAVCQDPEKADRARHGLRYVDAAELARKLPEIRPALGFDVDFSLSLERLDVDFESLKLNLQSSFEGLFDVDGEPSLPPPEF